MVCGIEILDPQEEPDPTCDLVSDRSTLPVTIGACQQDSGGGGGRANDDPSLGTPVVGQGWGVLDQIETQSLHEEFDGWVVLRNDDRDQFQVHWPSVGLGLAHRRSFAA